MRLTRFRIASLIAMLGCAAAWSASTRAQSGSARTASTAAPTTAQQLPASQPAIPAQPTTIAGTVATSAPLGLELASSDAASSTSDNNPIAADANASNGPSTQSNRFVRELSIPPDAKPSPGRKKQVIDLRGRIAANPNIVPSYPVSGNQQSKPPAAWVDSAIPQQMFDQAQMSPRQGDAKSASQPSAEQDAKKAAPPPGLAAPNSKQSVPTPTIGQQDDYRVPRDLAAPEISRPANPINQPPMARSASPFGGPSSESTQPPQALELGPGSQPTSVPDRLEATTTAPTEDRSTTPPLSNRDDQKLNGPTVPEIVGLQDALTPGGGARASAESDNSNGPRVTGQTYTPDQAIPKWIHFDPKQEEVPARSQTPSSKPLLPNASQPTGQANSPSPSAPSNQSQMQLNQSAPPSPPVAATPGQVIPDWVYGEAGSQPPQTPAARAYPPLQPAPSQPALGQKTPGPIPPSTAQPPVHSVEPAEAPRPTGPNASDHQDPTSQRPEQKTDGGAAKVDHSPTFAAAPSCASELDPLSGQVAYCPSDFSDCAVPRCNTFDPNAAAHVYRGKFALTTQRPLVELWRPLYTAGVYPPAKTWFGITNPMKPHFMVYGDMRTAVGVNQNSRGKSNVWGNVLNLDMDLQLTSTERVHAFVSPLNRGTTASGFSFNDELDIINGTNADFNTLFFEGDAGALLGGARGTYPPFDLPFSFGLLPLIYQNGIWANDAVLGAAVALPARHSRALNWSNFDASLFWATDKVTTDAFPNQDSAADFFGTAWFIDAYDGYIEADYAFVNDNTGAGRGYHNLSMAFTRRYFSRLSNSVRFIVNTGQEDLPKINRTADGHLLLIENSFITAYPNTIVPYVNLFYGQGRPQSLARAGIAGGILTNTGINFETDGITGYPTLDPTGSNAFGFAGGVNLLGSQFAHQLVLEFAMLQAVGSRQLRNAEGDEYGLGVRYQKPLSHNLIFRTDHMVGLRENATNISGSRFELRWKF